MSRPDPVTFRYLRAGEAKRIDEQAKPILTRFRLSQKQYKVHLKKIASGRKKVSSGQAELRNLDNVKRRISDGI